MKISSKNSKTGIKKITHKTAVKHKIVAKHKVKFHSARFCPKCGNALEGRNTFCKGCTVADFDFKDIKVVLCNSCNSYLHKNKWAKFKNLNNVIKIIAKDSIKSKVIVKNLPANTEENLLSYKAGVNKDFTFEVHHKSQLFELPAKLEVTLCTKCSKKDTTFFVSILQLRNANPEIAEFVRNEVKKQHKKGIYINKETRVDKYSEKDIDFFLTNKNFAKVLAQKLKKNFGGITKDNAQLFSIDWETSKNQYRLNVLVELPTFSKGDVLKFKDHLYKILSLKDRIHVQDIKTRAKTLLQYKQDYDVLKPTVFMVIKKYPECEILDPVTYYQARLMNPDDTLEINKEIHVVVDGGEAWMI